MSNPSAKLFYETANAFQRSAALKTAVELDLFTAIGEGCRDAQALAERCAASARGVRILADYMTVLGFLVKDPDGYRLTPDASAFLDRNSRAYAGGMLQFLLSPAMRDGFAELTGAVRQGGTVVDALGTTAADHPEWVTFARAMTPMMIGPAQWIAGQIESRGWAVGKVLDIAAGHGVFGVEIAKRCPGSEVVAVDWKNVLAVAEEEAQSAGIGDRYRTIPGSAFEVDFGAGYDLALLTNFLHHFDVPTCEGLLHKLHGALGPDGHVITLEMIPNDDRVSPASASFPIVMLATTPAGDAYTFSELGTMFKNAGFAQSELLAVPDSNEHIVITNKK